MFKQHIQAAIKADSSRSDWDVTQWRSYFREPVNHREPYRLTRTDVLNLLGPVRGTAVLQKVRQLSEPLYEAMAVVEGGVDITHKDAAAFLNQLDLQDAEKAAIAGLAPVVQVPRHQKLGLSDPRERKMKEALQ